MTGMRPASVVLVLLGLLWPAGVASADHGVPLAATYKTTPPATMGAGTDVAVKVTLTNTGDDVWVPFVSGTAPAAGQVALGPVPEGAASVTIDLVSEGLRWFGAGLPRPVTLGP